ncbi:hypothetical protein NA56DRAFT_737563 [Hyaloscypha hepaticicola]|uniref:Uncharacterized protein n=1 Tax=Hyaloscypha hepaticicola TaxID=2082293 RepID=A0A2J6PH45_9HELO|nr:hypothetical protein NA56DRAFT_737563 [Hyaloscypha hepaticicola]
MQKFQPNCTLPSSSPHFVEVPNVRGTLNIVWGCISIILSCTWSMLHLNVPPQFHKGAHGYFWAKSYAFLQKTMWMLFAVLAPEIFVGKALNELLSAVYNKKEMQNYAVQSSDWTLTHSFFANIGGFVLQFRAHEDQESDTNSSNSRRPGNIWILDASQLLFARECGIIKAIPPISVEAIDDKNKGDVVVKVLTLVQIVWLIMELAIRGALRLPVSQLEVVTLAFAITSILTYGMLWSKPKDAKFPILQLADRYPSSDELQDIVGRGPTSFGLPRVDCWIPNNSIHVTSAEPYNYSFLLGTLLGATAFGAPHFLGWNFVFPTRVEQILWRVSAIVTTVAPWTLLIMDQLIYRFPSSSGSQGRFVVDAYWHGDSRPRRIIWYCTTYTLVVVYVLSRLFVILEAFRCLYWLPEAIYKTTWSANIFHIS